MADSVLSPYFSRTRGDIKPGAHRISQLFGSQYSQFFGIAPSILISGTNGKGSTCTIVESILRQTGLKTGLYTSPHLVHPNERIRINGKPVGEDVLKKAVLKVEALSSTNLPDATFFEILTAVAILIFASEKCEVVVYEVGLGGRLDSTNAVSPTVSCVTSISLEHTEILGDTLQKIAWEKTHIARRNRPLVIGNITDDVYAKIEETALKIGAFIWPNKDFKSILSALVKNTWLDLNRQHVSTALNTIDAFRNETNIAISQDNIHKGLANAFWPGRFDIRKCNNKTFIFDAAHNPDGMTYFLTQLSQSNIIKNKKDSICFVFGALEDKDATGMLNQIGETQLPILLTQPTSPRAKAVAQLLLDANHKYDNLKGVPRLEDALENAQQIAEVIVVTGSIALVGEAMEILNIQPFELQNEYDQQC